MSQNREAGRRLKTLREAAGLSRQELAAQLGVDVTSIAGWEAGKYIPRIGRRRSIAAALGTTVDLLNGDAVGALPTALLETVDTLEELPSLLAQLLSATRGRLRAFRLAAPYSTPAYVQMEFRREISSRLLDGTIEVQRIEIVYTLDRLCEILHNIILYSGHPYWVKAHCRGLRDVAPAMGGYIFDDDEILIGAYWSGTPPHNQPGLRIRGQAGAAYFNSYWSEIWRRGELLNIRGGHDLSAARELAFELGLPRHEWEPFVERARTLEIGDDAPPLV